MKNPKKFFDIEFDPEEQPGHQTRYASLDPLSKGVNFTSKPDTSNDYNSSVVQDRRNKGQVFGSFGDIRLTPSIIIRRRGK